MNQTWQWLLLHYQPASPLFFMVMLMVVVVVVVMVVVMT